MEQNSLKFWITSLWEGVVKLKEVCSWNRSRSHYFMTHKLAKNIIQTWNDTEAGIEM